MNPVQYVADADSNVTSIRLRSEIVLLVLFGCVCLGSAASQQRAAQSIVIVLSVVDDKSQAVPQARIEIRAHEELLATELTDDAGKATATLQGRASLQLTVSKQGYLATSTVLDLKANTPTYGSRSCPNEGRTEATERRGPRHVCKSGRRGVQQSGDDSASTSSRDARLAGDSGRYITPGPRRRPC
jgi:hypothetical protein